MIVFPDHAIFRAGKIQYRVLAGGKHIFSVDFNDGSCTRGKNLRRDGFVGPAHLFQ